MPDPTPDAALPAPGPAPDPPEPPEPAGRPRCQLRRCEHNTAPATAAEVLAVLRAAAGPLGTRTVASRVGIARGCGLPRANFPPDLVLDVLRALREEGQVTSAAAPASMPGSAITWAPARPGPAPGPAAPGEGP